MRRRSWTKVWGEDLWDSQRVNSLNAKAQNAYFRIVTKKSLTNDEGVLCAWDNPDGSHEPYKLTDLAEELRMARNTCGRAIKAMEAAGLLIPIGDEFGVWAVDNFRRKAGDGSRVRPDSDTHDCDDSEHDSESRNEGDVQNSHRNGREVDGKWMENGRKLDIDDEAPQGFTSPSEAEADTEEERECLREDTTHSSAHSASQTRGHGDPLGKRTGLRPWPEVEVALQAGHLEATGHVVATWPLGDAWKREVCKAVSSVTAITPEQISTAFREWLVDRSLPAGSWKLRYWPENAQSFCLWAAGQGKDPRSSKSKSTTPWQGASPEVPREVVSDEEMERVAQKARTQPRPWEKGVGA